MGFMQQLPTDDDLRRALHDEIHARPPAQIPLPARVRLVAVLNHGVSPAQELAQLRTLPGQAGLADDAISSNFLRLQLGANTMVWERHSEFSRYSLISPSMADGWPEPSEFDERWMLAIPGRTTAAIELLLVEAPLEPIDAALAQAQALFGDGQLTASMLGHGHSLAVTDFRIREDGHERFVVMFPPGSSPSRAGRVSQRLLELEIYRLMALRGLPVAKQLAPLLSKCEGQVASLTAALEARSQPESDLLDELIHLAAQVERATAEHSFRFGATRAYAALVDQRLAELRERPIAGTRMLGEFLRRRLIPAFATVDATERRLSALSERIARTSALLRTRVDIATEAQNQRLLEGLQKGQALQLQLQSTVEGLSIAAISYYVVSLLLYGGKALKSGGWSFLNPELLAGALMPLVLFIVWRGTRKVHAQLHHTPNTQPPSR